MPFCPFRACRDAHRSLHCFVLSNLCTVLAVGGLAAVVALGSAYWLEYGRNRFLPKNFGVVERGFIYRSGQIHGDIVEDVLRDNHILTVIDLSGDSGRSHEAEQLAAVKALGIEKFDVEGLQGDGIGPIRSYALAYCKLIEERSRGRPVLVHCRAGSERTGTFFQLYRVLHDGWTPERAYAEYLRFRKKPPKSLKSINWLNEHLPVFIDLVCEDGALPEAPAPLPEFGP